MIKWVFLLLACVGLAVPAQAKKEWLEDKGSNFIIYHRQVPLDFVQTVMSSAEEDFRDVTANLGITRYQSWAWDKRAAIYIYKDEDDYVTNGGQAGWSHGSASVREKIIRTYPAANGFFDSILPHELGHIIFREFVGFNVDVPLWFEEGVAMYQEKAKRVGVNKTVKEAIENGQFIPLSRLTDMQLYKDTDQQVVNLFYAQSASIVYFMITQLGDQRFYQLCRELKDNTPFLTALTRVYVRVKTLDDLNKLWVNYLKEQ